MAAPPDTVLITKVARKFYEELGLPFTDLPDCNMNLLRLPEVQSPAYQREDYPAGSRGHIPGFPRRYYKVL